MMEKVFLMGNQSLIINASDLNVTLHYAVFNSEKQ